MELIMNVRLIGKGMQQKYFFVRYICEAHLHQSIATDIMRDIIFVEVED